MLNDLGFISRRSSSLRVEREGLQFVDADRSERARLFAERALELRPFAEFVAILEKYQESGLGNRELGRDSTSG